MNSFILGAVFSAAILNNLAPGPSMFLVLARASKAGLTAGLVASAGVVLAQMIYLMVAGAVLILAIPLSESLFSGLRLFGAVLLVYMAWRLLADARGDPSGPAPRAERGDFFHGVLVGLANPFNMIFMFAVLPQVLPAVGLTMTDGALVAVAIFLASALPKIILVIVADGLGRTNWLPRFWLNMAAAFALLTYAVMAVVNSIAA
ncbi:MAG: LysE family transporter [Rhodobacteraceae bacterium]|nr:LysE family transporter [Paracoccaceae bacterium]